MSRFNQALPSLILLLFFLFITYRITERAPVFNDELINLARTQIGFSDLPANILDYSLRPAYRILNQVWVAVFGQTFVGLWIGSALIAVAGAALLQGMTSRIGSVPLAAIAPLFFLTTPLFMRDALGAMPQMPSGVAGLASIYFLSLWFGSAVATEDREAPARRHASRHAALASAFGVLALLLHPVQLGYVVSMLAVFVVAIVLNVMRSGSGPGSKARYAVSDLLLVLGILLVAIAFVETIYRLTVYDTPSSRLLPGDGYTYLNLWRGNFTAVNNFPELLKYHKPADYYVALLFTRYPFFSLTTVALAGLGLGVVGWNLLRGKSVARDLGYFVPLFAFVIWLTIASISKMKTDYTLVTGMPLAAASNAVLFAYLIQRTAFLDAVRNVREGIAAALVLVIAMASFVAQRDKLLRDFAKRDIYIGAAYRLISGLPAGAGGIITGNAAEACISEECRGLAGAFEPRGCHYMFKASGRDFARFDVPGRLTAETAADMRKKSTVLCLSRQLFVQQPELAADLRTMAGFERMYVTKAGVEIWARNVQGGD